MDGFVFRTDMRLRPNGSNGSLVLSYPAMEHYYQTSFPYLLRFLFASRPLITGQVLGIVNRVITTHLVKKAGYSKKTARTGAVTLIQRFGSALNLNIHFHMLFLDGVYVDRPDGSVHRPPRS